MFRQDRDALERRSCWQDIIVNTKPQQKPYWTSLDFSNRLSVYYLAIRQPTWIKPRSNSRPSLKAVASSTREKWGWFDVTQFISSEVITPVEIDSRKSNPRFIEFIRKD